MTLPSSGSISLSQMRDEFRLGNPVSMSQMLGRGGAPSSGSISFSTMRGRSGAVFSPLTGTYSVNEEGLAQFTISCTAPATWTWTRDLTAITASVATGGSATSITFALNQGGSPSKPLMRSGSVRLTATSGDVTASYVINLTATPLN